MKKLNIIIGLIILLSFSLRANNIQITNVSLTDKNTTDHYYMVNFDITWDNSWRTSSGPSNWDAAWVFVKYRLKPGDIWHHATLHWVDGTGTNDGHTVPAGSTIFSLDDNGSNGAYGIFIYSANDILQQTVTYNGVKLRWDYGADGLADVDLFEIIVQGIEMVYVPQASYQLGDGLGTFKQFEDATTGNPYQVTSEAAITLGGGGAGSLGNNNNIGASLADDFDDATSKNLPAAFPKGFNAFYCMKYMISQEQYAVFLNTLSRVQQANRCNATNTGYFMYQDMNARNYPVNRNSVKCQTNPGALGVRTYANDLNDNNTYDEAADGQNIECNWLNTADIMAYLDWSGLRPMTELEFEKLSRGTLAPVAGEYAWGDTYIARAGNIANGGQASEIATNSTTCNAVYDNDAQVKCPMRCGAMALAGSTRREAGATYYGIMDITGGLWEWQVTVGHASGRIFTGTQGDGELDINGNRTNADWPNNSTGAGGGIRGGNWGTTSVSYNDLTISGRRAANWIPGQRHGLPQRYSSTGGRGVKSAQ